MVIVLYSLHNYPEYFDSYPVGMLVGIVLYLLFFGNRLGDAVLYTLVFCIIIVLVCQVLRCFVIGQIPYTPLFFARYYGVRWVIGYVYLIPVIVVGCR